MSTIINRSAPAALLAGVAVFWSISANAQMFDDPYKAPGADRAGLAIVMKQVDDGIFGGGSSVTSGGTGTGQQVLLCGGPSSDSSATGNSSCIVIGDGATGIIDLGQASQGDQSANSESNQTQNANVSDAAAIEEILSGGGS